MDVIAVSVENKEAISTVLRKARGKGIKVVTWDADAEKDARDVFVDQATPEGIAAVLLEHTSRLLGGKGSFAIVTASLTAANQNEWIKHIRGPPGQRSTRTSSWSTSAPATTTASAPSTRRRRLLKVHPEVKVIMAIASPAVPGAAEAVKQSGRTDVKVTGLGLPNASKPYLKDGVLDSVVLWNTMDLGYLTVQVANALAKGTLKQGPSGLNAGRLGLRAVDGDHVVLGTPFTFTKDNVDGFDF